MKLSLLLIVFFSLHAAASTPALMPLPRHAEFKDGELPIDTGFHEDFSTLGD